MSSFPKYFCFYSKNNLDENEKSAMENNSKYEYDQQMEALRTEHGLRENDIKVYQKTVII